MSDLLIEQQAKSMEMYAKITEAYMAEPPPPEPHWFALLMEWEIPKRKSRKWKCQQARIYNLEVELGIADAPWHTLPYWLRNWDTYR